MISKQLKGYAETAMFALGEQIQSMAFIFESILIDIRSFTSTIAARVA